MRLVGIRPGAIVKIHDGLPYFAEVIDRDTASLRVSPITGPRGVRTVRARQVVDHWRHASRKKETT